MSNMTSLKNRHPSTLQILRWFSYEHLPTGLPRRVSSAMARTARDIAAELEDGPELTAGLRKLLEAKDCFVRQAISDSAAQQVIGDPEEAKE